MVKEKLISLRYVDGMETHRPNIASKGFTLIELSIVLVIIGLLVGGVLVGQDLIRAATIRAQVSQIEKLQTAVNTFFGKYNCLPGDCAKATTYFGTTDAGGHIIVNGDGDGIINGYWSENPASCWADADGRALDLLNGEWGYWWANDACGFHTEWSSVFEHLSAAGLVEIGSYDVTSTTSNKPGVGYPAQKADGGGGVIIGWEPAALYIKSGHKIRLSVCQQPGVANNVQFTCGINAIESQAIDAKMDDGRPYSGTIVAAGPTYYGRIPGGMGGDGTSPTAGTCADGSLTTNSYLVTATPNWAYPDCALEVNANF